MAKRRSPPSRTAPRGRAAGGQINRDRRRRALKAVWAPLITALALLAFGSLGVWWWQRGPAFALQPNADRNILFVTIDTLRADALSCYGGPAQTPNLDRLAAEGARFTFAHAHAVVTLVSHTTMLTGHYPYEHGVRDNIGYRVAPGTATAATRLKALGFSTGAFVGGYPLTKRFGLSPGFDVYDDQMSETNGIVDFALPERRADVVVGRALDWINAQPNKFFAWVHVFDPHAPYRPPDEYLNQYRSQPYYGEVAWTDHALGPLFDRLATLSRPTLVIVTGDHGESLGEHGEETHGIFAYEATLHIPLIIADVHPRASRATRGVVVDSAVRHIDLLPTMLDAVGAPVDPTLPGASLRSVIADRGGSDRPEYFESMTAALTRGWAPLRGVLVGRDKYIDLPIPELYDLATDPHEQQNTVTADATQTAVLANTLRTYNVSPPNGPAVESHAVSEQLRALGYVSSGPHQTRDHYTDADDPKRLIVVDQTIHHATDLYETGHAQEAISTLEKLLAERPGTEDVYQGLAFMYWQTGQPSKAISTLYAALGRGITANLIATKFGIYLAQTGQAKRAIQMLEKIGTDDVETDNALGMAYSEDNRPADAMREFQKALALDPTSGLTYQNIATIQLNANQVQEAETSLRKALQLDPALAPAYTELGVVLSRTNRTADAIESWQRAIALDRTEYNALYNLVIVLGQSGRTEEARAYGRQFVASAPPALFADEIAEVRHLIGGGNIN